MLEDGVDEGLFVVGYGIVRLLLIGSACLVVNDVCLEYSHSIVWVILFIVLIRFIGWRVVIDVSSCLLWKKVCLVIFVLMMFG